MVCPSFNELSQKEKTEYIGALTHCVQSHEMFFEIGKEIIRQGKALGLFEGVVISPEPEKFDPHPAFS